MIDIEYLYEIVKCINFNIRIRVIKLNIKKFPIIL